MGSTSSDYQLPQGVLGDQDYESLSHFDLEGKEAERECDLTHIDFVRNEDLNGEEVGPWRSLDVFSRKVLIVRYYCGRAPPGASLLQTSKEELIWSEPQVQAFFQRYTDDEEDWRASHHFGNVFGSSSGISEEDRADLKTLLTEGKVLRGSSWICLERP